MKEPTIQDIANAAGVAVSTVSKAMHNRPGVNPKLKEKIQKIAKELGYRPNPFAQSLVFRRKGDKSAFHGTLACLLGHEQANPLPIIPHYRTIAQGIKAHAQDLGFNVEFFWVYEPHMTGKRLDQIIRARGIPGVILLSMDADEVDIDWKRYSCAYASHIPKEQSQVRFSFTYPDNFELMRQILRYGKNLGYTKIGLSMKQIHDGEQQHCSSAFLAYQQDLPKKKRIPIHRWPHDNFDRDDFLKWIHVHKPDLVVSSELQALKYLSSDGFKVPEEMGFLFHGLYGNIHQDKRLSGMYPPYEDVGAAAVDLVVGQLYRGEMGPPKRFKGVFIEPMLLDGATVKPQN
ncbi:MAG: LacI family DNA-binding transcriptional regulator [Verrucomicrobiota bacterium]